MGSSRAAATNVAARAISLALGPEISYDELDCQAFVEQCVNDCGGRMAYAGSNAMARGATWLGTIANAKAMGKLVPGAGLLIHEDDESELPAKYRGDGLGDFSHVGLYVGKDALYDVDKHGLVRLCDVVHSGSTMGRVAGSTLANGWTHVIWFPEIDYGVDVTPGVELGAETDGDSDETIAGATESVEAVVYAANGAAVKLRVKPSAGRTIWRHEVPVGDTVTVIRRGDEWCRVRWQGHAGYMMTKFLTFG